MEFTWSPEITVTDKCIRSEPGERVCCECGGIIGRNVSCEVLGGWTPDHKLFTSTFCCLTCKSIRDDLLPRGCRPGTMREFLKHKIGMDYITGQFYPFEKEKAKHADTNQVIG